MKSCMLFVAGLLQVAGVAAGALAVLELVRVHEPGSLTVWIGVAGIVALAVGRGIADANG
jgi:hypothetical protein